MKSSDCPLRLAGTNRSERGVCERSACQALFTFAGAVGADPCLALSLYDPRVQSEYVLLLQSHPNTGTAQWTLGFGDFLIVWMKHVCYKGSNRMQKLWFLISQNCSECRWQCTVHLHLKWFYLVKLWKHALNYLCCCHDHDVKIYFTVLIETLFPPNTWELK